MVLEVAVQMYRVVWLHLNPRVSIDVVVVV